MRLISLISFITIMLLGNHLAWGADMTLDTVPPPPSEVAFKIVEYMPHFPGCEDIEDKGERKTCSDEKIVDFIAKNVKYPTLAREQGVEGTAVIRYIVKEDGTLQIDDDKAILRNPGAGCGEEALRVVKLFPKWIPGMQRGKKVPVQFTLPIKFKLTEDEELVPVPIKLGSAKIEGSFKAGDISKYSKANITLSDIQSALLEKRKGLPISINFGETKGGYAKYYVSVGKDGKKFLIDPELTTKGMKKKIVKLLKAGSTLYFYNWEFKKTFMEIMITE